MRTEQAIPESQAGASHKEASFAERALDHLLSLQSARGDWEGEMVWNTMILSQYVIVRHVVGRPFTEAARDKAIAHYRATQAPEGGWGMHSESGPYVFFTTLAYVALRLLGVRPDEPMAARARAWLHAQPGGVLSNPSWGKYWLAFLDLYDYSGVNPCPPELFLLPESLPIHPSHYYCHTRNIYLGLSFLYGSRFRANLGDRRDTLRAELYRGGYSSVDFPAHRNELASTDAYIRPGKGLRLTFELMRLYERAQSRALRKRALDACFERILYEQRTSRYQGLSPVNGLLDCLAIYCRDPEHPELIPSIEGVESWRWEDDAEGLRYAGARSNTWDTAFAMQAILAGGTPPARAIPALQSGYRFLLGAQLVEQLPDWESHHRDFARGGWCFSDGAHRWPVSDCTAEAVGAILQMHSAGLIPKEERIDETRLKWACEFILSRQNEDGGFGTYERRRGSGWLESINPTEMYGNCMTELSYLECTASAIAALAELRGAHPHWPKEMLDSINRAIERGTLYLRGRQRGDGSWPGFWGVNFTYAIFHVVRALRTASVPAQDSALQRAAHWLESKQRADGGWGEHYLGCLGDRYLEHPHSQVVMTSWALLALLETRGPQAPSVQRGLAFLRSQQRDDGGFPGGALNGVFFGSAMLDYRYYKSYFPLWTVLLNAKLSSH